MKGALKNTYRNLREISRGNYFAIKKYAEKSLFWARVNQKKKMRDKRRQALVKSVLLTKEQKESVKKLYGGILGYNISLDCHKYYTAISDSFDERYIPELIFNQMELLFCDRHAAHALSNKMIQHRLVASIEGIYVPKVYAQVHGDKWFSDDGDPMTLQQVVELLENVGEAFAKPISDSCSGIGCSLIRIKGGVDMVSGLPITELLSRYRDNYMIEEIIHCSDDVAKIHPASVNTFRIVTYRLDNQIFSCPVVMRVGRNNSNVDNSHAGGLMLAMSNDGVVVKEHGVTEFNERFTAHPDSGVTFMGYRVRNFDRCLAVAKKMHALFNDMDIISWDITINEHEQPTFIEMNTLIQSPWLPQMPHGVGMFGENTDAMLEKLKKRKKSL